MGGGSADPSPLLASVDSHREWLAILCNVSFDRVPSASLDLDLRFGHDPRDEEVLQVLYPARDPLQDSEDDDDDADTHRLLAPIADGLWLIPIAYPEHMADFWALFRRQLEDLDAKCIEQPAYKFFERRNEALEIATHAAIHAQLDSPPPLQRMLARIAAEARLDLRFAEIVLISYQAHVGLLQFRTTAHDDVFLLASTMYKIRLYHLDLIHHYSSYGGIKSRFERVLKPRKGEWESFTSARTRLRDLRPSRTDSVVANMKFVAKSLLFLDGFYAEGVTFWKNNGRLQWDDQELDTLLKLHDLAIRILSRIASPSGVSSE